MDKKKIYTLGYTIFQNGGAFDIVKMFSVLKSFNVSYLVDVRSIPYSKQFPQCNMDNLKLAGNNYGIPYIHMPEVGAKATPDRNVFTKASEIFFDDIFPISKSNRPEDSELNASEEIVDFNKFRNDDIFVDGLKRIERAYDKNFTLALMCSEKNPMDCHRYFFISKALEQRFGDWIDVEHIIKNKNGDYLTVSNSDLDKELQNIIFKKDEIRKLDIENPSLMEPAKINKYFGNTTAEKKNDFCDRYWNLMHGWKKYNNTNFKIADYD